MQQDPISKKILRPSLIYWQPQIYCFVSMGLLHFTQMESYNVCPFVSQFFHSTSFFEGWSHCSKDQVVAWYSINWIVHILLPTHEWMGICIVSTFWTMMNYAAVNIHVQAFVYACFHNFWYIPGSGVDGSHSNSAFNYLRIYHSGFQPNYPILYSDQQCVNVLISTHPCQLCYVLTFWL
jgi:hypothetical protein